MDIEPLKTLLSLANNKKETLLHFLSDDIKQQVSHLEYEESELYINDKVYCIRRDNLQLEIIGKIILIDENKIGIRLSSVRNQFIDRNKYYMFIQCKKAITTQRELMKQLLQQL
jgi:hypothetical protein